MIECTSLFPNSSWAQAHIEAPNLVRFNIQYGNKIKCIHMDIDKISNLLDMIRREQTVTESLRNG